MCDVYKKSYFNQKCLQMDEIWVLYYETGDGEETH